MSHVFTTLAFETREEASAVVAEMAAKSLREGIETLGSASLALSGGNTPGRSMELLSNARLDWDKVSVGLVDDRFVATDHEGSNEGLVRRTLMQGAAANAHFISMWHEGESPLSAAALANTAYKPHSPFDFMLLGMGGDGHTASWFPHTSDLSTALTSEEIVIAVDSEDVPGARNYRHRITLTNAAIGEARNAVMLLFGEDRKDVFFESLGMSAKDRPVSAAAGALGDRLTVIWAP